MKGKRGVNMQSVLIHIILVALIFAMFFLATAEKINARGVKQQVVEQQAALMIESAIPGMSFSLPRYSIKGYTIDSFNIKNGRVFAGVNGLASARGYPYFTTYKVKIDSNEENFVITIYE